ncbi:efflux transporter outer membrane subunit [Ignatzschineria rhizosphaerae]|uniref:Efflux transporter outer membrane subunit n=1 Tax=Ignatzschineria rhizosphaerae TaxID=2923279 RepID=A0ABY3X6A6_9GAMM|nr:efflux transporter outer membrane subunit [Ignatzschineria rhizosphaerae]UNM96271.1 efflux transporter outer membrane subunit [Ignatzschineria rhizosphaerae]
MKKTLLFIGAPFVLAACSMAPNYERPGLPVIDSFPASSSAKAGSLAEQSFAYEITWEQYFKDPRLKRLITLALENNKDLQLATLNMEAARIAYGISVSERLPGVNVGGGYSRNKTGSANTGINQLTGQPNGRVISESSSINFGVSSYEIDFFGKAASMSDAAFAKYLASEEGQKAAHISLISGVARGYLTEVLAEEQLRVAKETLNSNRASYNLVQQQVTAGIANDLDLAQARGQVFSAQAQVANFEGQLGKARNALYTLVGVVASDLPKGLPLRTSHFTEDLPVGLPSQVLLVRPDVMEAEYNLLAANADIGAARAAFFPSISLTATVGRASSDLSDLFDGGRGGWSFSPTLSLPIFNWGELQKNLELSHVRKNMSIVTYEKAIQTAFQEVSDGLVAKQPLANQLRAQQNLVATTSEQLRLANLLYTNGIASYLDVLDAQRTLFSSRQSLLSTYFEKHINDIMLYAALGGGVDAYTGDPKRTNYMEIAASQTGVAKASQTGVVKGKGATEVIFSTLDDGKIKVSTTIAE